MHCTRKKRCAPGRLKRTGIDEWAASRSHYTAYRLHVKDNLFVAGFAHHIRFQTDGDQCHPPSDDLSGGRAAPRGRDDSCRPNEHTSPSRDGKGLPTIEFSGYAQSLERHTDARWGPAGGAAAGGGQPRMGPIGLGLTAADRCGFPASFCWRRLRIQYRAFGRRPQLAHGMRRWQC